ncbi:MAG TPA: EAL domain-containing protein [Steroidobacteraceae bacterium]|nr:EAL domain-containing protein [Steroidobacteraceae bacterium]
MTSPPVQDERPEPWGSLEPFAQLFRALLPRASSIALYSADGQLRWSSDTTGPDVTAVVEGVLPAAKADAAAVGDVRIIGGQAGYLFWLRHDEGALLAGVAVLCRSSSSESEPRSFAFVHSLLRPALECLRRDLLAREAAGELGERADALERDLDMILADATGSGRADGNEELKQLIQRVLEHEGCLMVALLVPEKGIAFLRGARDTRPDSQLVARTHRQFLTMAQTRADPQVINNFALGSAPDAPRYRVLVCPVRSIGGRTMGVLTLVRSHDSPKFTQRDRRMTEIMSHRAAAVIASHYDALSGLYTRQALEQRVRALIIHRDTHGKPWSALYVDCDRMHVINDHFGMHVGDTVIGQLGELIRTQLPHGALAARISGDRFAVLLPASMEDAAQFAESLRAGAEMLARLHSERNLGFSVSIGVAPLQSGESGELAHSLVAAETACKAAKDRGRNRVASYEDADQSVIRRLADIDVAGRVRRAIMENRMRLDAQLITPVIPSAERPVHYELLLRMLGDDGTVIGPDAFLGAAVRYQMMATIDRWVLEQAITLLKPYSARLADRPFVVSINFSGQSLGDDDFAEFLIASVEKSGLNPRLFCFELTENATILNLARAERLMRRLRRLGCEVALDDFGTGLCSLSYLRQLPVTMLKIDGSFVRDVVKDPRADSMVQAITQLARTMSLDTVAEYVESEEIRQRIAGHGVEYGQGYAIAHPVPFAELLAEMPQLAEPVAREPRLAAGS